MRALTLITIGLISLAFGVILASTLVVQAIRQPTAADVDVNQDGAVNSGDQLWVVCWFGSHPNATPADLRGPCASRTPTPSPSPTATPTATPTLSTACTPPGNIASEATVTGGEQAILTDARLDQDTTVAQHLYFSCPGGVTLKRVGLWTPGGINWISIYLTGGSAGPYSMTNIDFGGPNTCLVVNFAPKEATLVEIDTYDANPLKYQEIELWTDDGTSGLTCGSSINR